RAVAAQPGYYKPYLDLGLFRFNHGQYEEALTAFRAVTALAPDLALGHTNLGVVYADLGRYGDAEAEYRTALRLRENEEAFENLAGIMAYQHRDADAIEFYRRALALSRPDFRLSMNVADSYRRLGRGSDARGAYKAGLALAEDALRDDPRDGYARAFAAYFYGRLGDTKRALLEIEQALRLSPFDARVRRRAVILYEALGQRSES